MDIGAICRQLRCIKCFWCVRLRHHVWIEHNVIDRHHVFTSEVLSHARDKRLCEEESRDPETGRWTLLAPGKEHVVTVQELVIIRGQRFSRRERTFFPELRYLSNEQIVGYGLELFREENQSLHSLLNALQGRSDNGIQTVVAHAFLHQHHTHRVRGILEMSRGDLFEIEQGRQTVQHIGTQAVQHRISTSAGGNDTDFFLVRQDRLVRSDRSLRVARCTRYTRRCRVHGVCRRWSVRSG